MTTNKTARPVMGPMGIWGRRLCLSGLFLAILILVANAWG